MKTNLFVAALLLMGLGSYSKNAEMQPTAGSPTKIVGLTEPTKTIDATNQKLLAQGTFSNGVHPTSCTVKLYESGTVRTLLFSDFKTGAGPDLRIWLAETKQAQNYVEVSSKLAAGTFFVELPTTADPTKQMQVLIWCKQFSVLFGSAKLL